MKIINYETKNPFATFSLRSRRIRKGSGGVVGSAVFLTGVVAVVLVSMFASSLPSFAQDARNTITLSTVVPTGAYNFHTSRSFLPYRNVTFPIIASPFIQVTTSGSVSGEGAGTSASLEGDVLFYFTNEADINGLNYGIEVTSSGNRSLIFSNKGDISYTDRWGVRVAHTGTGGIEITNEGFVGSESKGVLAEHTGTGDIEFTNERSIWGEDIGVHAKHVGTGDIEITNKLYSWGSDLAILAEHDGEGNIGITNEFSVRVNGTGMIADHDGTGDIGITNRHLIWGGDVAIRADHTSEGDIVITNVGTVRTYYHTVRALYGTYSTAIDVDHTGEGDIVITNNRFVRDSDISIHSEHEGTGDIEIVNRGAISADVTAIIAEHTGTGNIGITNEDHQTIHTFGNINILAEHTGIRAGHTGEGNIGIYSKSNISANDTGIHADHDGTGDIVITNSSRSLIWARDTGIIAEHTGIGDIGITNYGWNVWGNNIGIHANHTGMGNIGIVNEDVVHGYYGTGIFADHDGTGDIEVSNRDTVWTNGTGIHADHIGNGDIRIVNGDEVWAHGTGIHTDHDGTGDIVITNKKYIKRSDIGIRASHDGAGDIGIVNEDELGADDIAIRAEHTGTGDIGITNERITWGNNIGVHADHAGMGNIGITNERSLVGNSNAGIHAEHADEGDIGIVNEDYIQGNNNGIRAEHAGTGDIGITNKGVVDGATGIHTEHAGTGDIGIVNERHIHGIEAIHTGAGEIEIDISGTVSSGETSGPINMVSAGTKTLVLRPGFELRSGQDHVDIISAGGGDGILVLNQDDDLPDGDDTPASESLDFGALNFQGFNEFAKRGGNTWKISGVASDAERFDRATISEGTLRFAGGVTFKMAHAETASDPNYFSIEDGAVLEVAGSNILNGNLNNLGKVVFTYDRDAEQNPAGVLAVGTDYKGGGEVVFDVGSGSWQVDEIRIGRDYVNPTEVTEVGISGVVSNFVSSENEYLPMEIEVAGSANPGSFATGKTGGYDVNHHKYLLGHYPETDEQGDVTLHRWKFYRGAELSTSSSQGFSYEDDLTGETDSEGETSSNPDEEDPELGIRADISGHTGGVWGTQQRLRTSTGPNVVASRGLRKDNHRVYFGYDTPAMGFMGGDMVVRTSVMRGLSISDAFSSSGRNRIDMESDAASLSASWQSPGGFYASGGTRYVRSSSNISAEGFAVTRDNEGVGVSASAKAGYRFAVPLGGMYFSVAPQVQLLWSRVDFDDFVGLTGEVVSLEDGQLVTGRLGLLWDGEWQDAAGSGRIYGKMNLHNAVDGVTTVSVSGVPLSRERSDLSADGRLGVSYEWDEGYAVHGEVSALRRDDAEEIRVDFGMSIEF